MVVYSLGVRDINLFANFTTVDGVQVYCGQQYSSRRTRVYVLIEYGYE